MLAGLAIAGAPDGAKGQVLSAPFSRCGVSQA